MRRYRRPPGWWRSCAALAFGLIGALLVLVPQTAVAAISAGPTVTVPWMTNDFFFENVTAAVLADGSFAIASTVVVQLGPEEYSAALEAQFFRSNGGAQTRPLVLIRPPSVVINAGVGSLGTRYFLVWEDFKRAHAAFYSEQGTIAGQPFNWPYSGIEAFARYYRFGSAPRWRFLPITFQFLGEDADDVPSFRVFVREADHNGALLGPPLDLAPERLEFFEDAAINGSGSFVVVSSRCSSTDPSIPCIRGLQIFKYPVRPSTPFLSVDVAQDEGPGGVGNGAFTASIGPQGQVLLTWFTDQHGPAPRFVARLYDENGLPASDELQVVTPAVPDLSSLRAKALDDGTFVLSWLLYRQADRTSTLVVDRFDPRTKSFDEPVVVAEGPIVGALLELNGAGRGVVVWQTQAFNDEGKLISNAGHFRTIRVKR